MICGMFLGLSVKLTKWVKFVICEQEEKHKYKNEKVLV